MGPRSTFAELPADQRLLLIVAALVTACLIVAGVILVFNFQTSTQSAHAAASQHARPRIRRRQAAHSTAAATREEDEEDDITEAAAQGGSTSRRASAKKRRGRARRQQQAERTPQALNGVDEDDDDDVDEDGGHDQDEPVAMGRSAYDVEREEKDRGREEAELAEQERIRRLQELKSQQAEAELAHWKGHFSVDASGEDAQGQDELQKRREAFCAKLKHDKVVELQELSLLFSMNCSEVVAEVRSLEEEGALTGVLDDRGKYIYLSMEELRGLAALIESEGRISVSRLAQEATSLLNIVPSGHGCASGVGEDTVLDEVLA